MAIALRLPNGGHATNGDEQLSDCIIASSNRFADLMPFCDNTYNSDKTWWGSILPWEFPQNATREVEEAFLRGFFTEVEIHMQGGAQGAGSGFRFLKHAWYSIALRNLHYGIPAIAEKWMNENVVLLEDPTMRGHLCEPEVTPETFFRSHEIQLHTSKLLKLVIPVIQAQAKIRYEQSVEETSSTESQRPTTNVTPASDRSEAEVRPAATTMPASVAHPAAPPKRELPITSAMVPTDPYAGPSSSYQGTKNRHFRDFTPGYSQHTQQINNRKRDSQNSSNSFNRSFGNGRRQSDNHHQFQPNLHPAQAGFSSGASSFVPSAPGPMSAPLSDTAFSLYGAPPGQVYHSQGLQTSRQQVSGPYAQPIGPVSQDMLSSNAFHNTPRQQFSQPRHFSNHSDNERFSYSRARNTSFNEVSITSGDARRTSFGSRGGSVRGQYRAGGRGRGGRTRDSSHGTVPSSEEHALINQAPSDYYLKSGHSLGKRHSSAYHEPSWRSHSERPQVENAQPQRVLSGPDQYPSFQDYQGSTGTRLLPPFIFPHGPAVTHQGPPTLHRPLQSDMIQNSATLPDCEVGNRYIGADAVHVNELVVFNIPVEAEESEVAKAFAHACDVDVTNIKFTVPRAHIPIDAKDKMAVVRFRNHQVARRVLDLREVDLYGRPLRIEVPYHFIEEFRLNFGKPPIPRHRGQGVHALPPRDVDLWFQEPANSSLQLPQHNMQMGVNPSFVQSNETSYAGYPASTPFHSATGGQPLSVVQSVNATPVSSGPNTPKKPQSKNTKKSKKSKNNKTPLASGVEGEGATASSQTTALEAPVKPPKQKRQDRASLVDDGLPLAPIQISRVDSLSGSKTAKGSETIQSPEKSVNSDYEAAAASSRPLHETPLKQQSQELEKDCSQKSPAASKVALPTRPSSVPRTTPTVEPTASSGDAPAAVQISDHPQVCLSEVASGITPKTQLPIQQSLPSQSSPPSNRSIRPASVDRRLSDSDHVDESFHTASASPPDDKQIQAKDVTAQAEQPARISQLTKPKPKPDSPTSPVSSQSGKGMAPNTLKSSPKTGIPVSIQSPTPSKNKARSNSGSKDSKSQRSTPQRDVVNSLENPKAISTNLKSDDCHTEVSPSSPTNVVQHVFSASSGLEQAPGSQTEEKMTDATKQRAISTNSVPPTSAATEHSAPQTPASLQVSVQSHSPTNSSSKPKAVAKKGPSQTESLSMFGKKQKKQKKSAKGKGTIKGKPQDSGSTSGFSDGVGGRDLSGIATPTSTAIESTNGKDAGSLNVTPRLDSRAIDGSDSEESKSTVSRQESPGKGGILGSLGGLGRVGNFFSMASSPSVTGHGMMPQDAVHDRALTYSKAPVAVAPISSSIENDPVDNPSTISDLGDKNDSSVTHNDALSISTMESSKSRQKKRQRNRKQKKREVEQQGGSFSAGTEGDGDVELVSTNSIAGAAKDTTTESHDVDIDNRSDSDDSSITMGRPTPQASPKKLSASKRKRVENRLANSEQHIITPPAPRNQHVKRKSYSRSASSATGLSKRETTPPTPTHAVSETEIEQQNSVLRVYEIENSGDDEDGSQQTRPRVLIISRSGSNEGRRLFPLTAGEESGTFKFIHFGGAEGDQAVLGPEQMELLRSTKTPVGRVLEEVDSEGESSK